MAAARAYVWAKSFGPLKLGVPRSGDTLERFAGAVMRSERAKPGTLARALGGERPAQAVFDQLARTAKEQRAAPALAAQPGSETVMQTKEERDRVVSAQAQGTIRQAIENAQADPRGGQGGFGRPSGSAAQTRSDGEYSPSREGYHHYQAGPNLVCSAQMRCTAEEIADQMSRFAVPGQSPDHQVQSLQKYPVYDPVFGIFVGRS